MNEATDNLKKRTRVLWTLAMVNVGIWAIAMIALVFLMRHSPGVRNLYPILASGPTVAIVMISVAGKLRKSGLQ